MQTGSFRTLYRKTNNEDINEVTHSESHKSKIKDVWTVYVNTWKAKYKAFFQWQW